MAISRTSAYICKSKIFSGLHLCCRCCVLVPGPAENGKHEIAGEGADQYHKGRESGEKARLNLVPQQAFTVAKRSYPSQNTARRR